MFRRKNGQCRIILISLAAMFALGLILGTLALFYLPDEIRTEATEALNMPTGESFTNLLKENFFFEVFWSVILWILGSSAVTAPFTGAVIALRGFAIGFSVAFISGGDFNNTLFLFGSILPQCLTALPFMSFAAMLCVIYAQEKRYKDGNSLKYFLYGAMFVCLALFVAAAESGLTVLVKKCF
ncbi:MAG: stage II sporulation protein M [Clostridia bacterium]|nr:stage II sporulation protein M [Clostridia bacterium]